jgi:hypothetical protein
MSNVCIIQTLDFVSIRRYCIRQGQITGLPHTGEFAMTRTKLMMMNNEDRLVSRTLLGFLTAPLGFLIGMGLLISL